MSKRLVVLLAVLRCAMGAKKMKVFLSLGVVAVVLALNLCAVADVDEVLFQGNVFCLGVDDCRNFANSGVPGSVGYVVLYEADGHTISDYLWINSDGEMTFESDDSSGGFAQTPPPGIPFLGGLIENGTLQEFDQFFPDGGGHPLFIESKVDTTPEPSTLLLVGPAAVFLFGRARRFWRA